MGTLWDHLEGVIAVVSAAVLLIGWFVRLEMKVRTMDRDFTACRAVKVQSLEVTEKVHDATEKIQQSLRDILERLVRVETKLDRNSNGGGK